MLDYHSWPQAARELTATVYDFAAKEAQLAKAEVATALASIAQGAVWLVLASVFLFFSFIVATQAAIFAIAATGIALHWACLIVMGCYLVAAILCGVIGRSLIVKHSIVPTRAITQFNRAIDDMRSDTRGPQ